MLGTYSMEEFQGGGRPAAVAHRYEGVSIPPRRLYTPHPSLASKELGTVESVGLRSLLHALETIKQVLLAFRIDLGAIDVTNAVLIAVPCAPGLLLGQR